MSLPKIKKKKLKGLPGQEVFKDFKSLLQAVKDRMGTLHNTVTHTKGRR